MIPEPANTSNSQDSSQFSVKDFQLSYRRQFTKNLMVILTGFTLLVIFLPVLSILLLVIINGLPVITANFPDFFLKPTGSPYDVTAGMANAIQGTVIIVGIAALIGLPLGMLAGIRLAEGKQSILVNLTRFISRVLIGLPSVVAGLIIYFFIVIPLGQNGFSSVAGGLALTLLIVPMIAITTEEALRTIPTTYREASLALGIPTYRINIHILIRGSMNIILTGIVIAIARIGGETAPLIFTIAGNLGFSRTIFATAAALPLNVYNYALSNSPVWVKDSWGAALILLMLAMFFTVIVQTDVGKSFLNQIAIIPSRMFYKKLVHGNIEQPPGSLEYIMQLNFILFVFMIAGSIITLTGGLYIILIFIFIIITFPFTIRPIINNLQLHLKDSSLFLIMINSFLAFVFLIITYLFIFQTSSTLSLLSSNLVYLIVLLIVIGIVLIGISFINKKSIKQNISNNYQRYLTNVAPIYKVLLYLIAVIICLDGLYNTSIFTLDYFQRFGYTLNDVIALVLIVFAGIGIIVLSIVSGLLPKRIGLYLSKEQHVSKSGRLLLILYSGINFLIISTGVGFRIDSPVVSIISLFEQVLTLIQQIVMLAFSLIQLIVINILSPILLVDNVSRVLLNFLNPLSLLIINVFIILYTIGINLGLIISPLTVLVLFFDKNVTSYFKNKNASNLNSGNQSTNQ